MPFCCYHTTVQHVLHLIQQFHVEFPSLRSNGHFSRWSWVSRYQNVSILDFIGSKDDGAGAIAYVVWCPCSDFMDMFWRLTNCVIIIIIRCAKLQSNHYHQLHWMPVKHRITFKVAALMHQAFHRHSPPYLADLVAFSSTNYHQQLRSTTTRAAAIWTQFRRVSTDLTEQISRRFPGYSRRDLKKNPGHVCIVSARYVMYRMNYI